MGSECGAQDGGKDEKECRKDSLDSGSSSTFFACVDPRVFGSCFPSSELKTFTAFWNDCRKLLGCSHGELL